MKQKFYINKEGEETAWEISVYEDEILSGEIKEIELIEMEREFGTSWRYCRVYRECFEKEDYMCGIVCDEYNPCNGTSGKCTHLDVCLIETGKIFKLTKDGLFEINKKHG